MADSQRLRSTSEGLRLVSTVAGRLAEDADGETSVLAVTTYFPADVDSVARVFEGLEEIEGIERVEKGPLTIYRIDDGDRFATEGPEIDDEAFVDEASGFMRAVGELKRDPDWADRVRKQHELLRIIAESGETELDLSYLTSRAGVSRARVQSLLNDFDAQGYIGSEVDEDVDTVRYQFPAIDYPRQRYDRNMERLEEVEPPARSRMPIWVVLATVAVVVLLVVMLLRL